MTDKLNRSEKLWLVMTGFSCNNNCAMCTTKPKAKNYSDRKTEEIIKDLIKGREKQYKKVEFTGGEPTIRPDILDLIIKAKHLNYEQIALSTNARMFSYDSFCRKIIKAGLNRVTSTLSAHNSRLGQAVSRTPDSFEQTVQGIKNILKYHYVGVSVNTVLMRVNYKYLYQIGDFIHDLGVQLWHVLDLIPDGYGKDFYNIFSVKATDLSESFDKLKDLIKKFDRITFFDFPLCIFSPFLRENKKICLITTKRRTIIGEQIGYTAERFKKSKAGFYKDIHKRRIKICQRCKFVKDCGGIWRNYLDLYGEQEIKYLAVKHSCLEV